jgi:subtilisin family serine protease
VSEVLEARIVLSAQPLLDVLHHVFLESARPDEAPATIGQGCAPVTQSSLDVEQGLSPLTTQAHANTGWNQVQQQYGLQGTGQTVAVIDSGIAWDHHALGRGFGPGYRIVGGWDFAENDAQPYDDAPAGFHGTHVAGIIGSDSIKQPGVAPDVDLVALRVFNDAGKGQLEWTERALQWVYDNRFAFANPITTVNLSLGTAWNGSSTPAWASLEEELKQIHDAGIVVVASAGNSFKDYRAAGLSYPAASPWVIPVSSVDADGSLSDFSQRHDRVIAAPGRSILSTIPDHVLGRDGKVDDWTVASGTSMAAPYVSGASVLVRQAMQMAGVTSIDTHDIYKVLQDTSDSVWDAITGQSYDRLNLAKAIDAVLPDDSVGDTWANATSVALHGDAKTNGWINHLGDRDVFQFTAQQNGTLRWTLEDSSLGNVQWTLWTQGVEGLVSEGTQASWNVQEGKTYAIGIKDMDSIGSFRLAWDFTASSVPSDPMPSNPKALGQVDYLERSVSGSESFALQATRDGIMTLQLDAQEIGTGSLRASVGSGAWQTDSTWDGKQLRLDLEIRAGETVTVQMPGLTEKGAQLEIVNLVQRLGNELHVSGTSGGERVHIDLASGTQLAIGDVPYRFGKEIAQVYLDGQNGNDQLALRGTPAADKMELKPGELRVETSRVQVRASGFEEFQFDGAGGADRAIVYDSSTDDTLTARPHTLEMVGIGYQVRVQDVDRIFVHATSGGQDIAYLHDSAGNDVLSIRPQFSSLRSDDYFNYINGFEKVYAYATGGADSAQLYDSPGDDRFNTSGDNASIVGPGFFSFTRNFERVEAFATAGGNDTSALYAASRQSISVGTDFSSFEEGIQSRLARGFERNLLIVNGSEVKATSLSGPGTQALEATPLTMGPSQTTMSLAGGEGLGTDREHGEMLVQSHGIPRESAWHRLSPESERTAAMDVLSEILDGIDTRERADQSAVDWIADAHLEERIRQQLFERY